HVRPRLDEAENRRAFVVISDAFRYEAAQELVRELNGKYRFEATLSSQLGVLPSYTALGMASLLPHKSVAYKASGDVLVDGQPTATFEQRSAVLQAVDGMACRAEDLMAKKKEEGREFVKDKRVVYVYHNAVDATGEQAATEPQPCAGVRGGVNELAARVGSLVNTPTAGLVFTAADRGFLSTEPPPAETARSKLEEKPAGTVKAKKRYLL